MTGGPSDFARAAARGLAQLAGRGGTLVTAEQVVEAAHDPGLGLDRSVCLRDVVAFMRTRISIVGDDIVAVEREFGARGYNDD